jgi:hypothetical protein
MSFMCMMLGPLVDGNAPKNMLGAWISTILKVHASKNLSRFVKPQEPGEGCLSMGAFCLGSLKSGL